MRFRAPLISPRTLSCLLSAAVHLSLLLPSLGQSAETAFMIWHLEAGGVSLLCTFRPDRKNGSSKFFHSPFIRPVKYAARPVHTWRTRAGSWAPHRFRAVAEGALQGWLSGFFCPRRMRRVLVPFQNVLTCHRIQALAGTALRSVLFTCCLLLPAILIQF